MSKLDLHIHTTHSDGKLSVPQIAEIIKEKKIEYCALADHNSISGIQELIDALEGSGIIVIPAAELTAKHNNNEIHVLAYDFNIASAAKIIKERNEIVHSQKIEEMKLAIKLSREAGLEVTEGLSLNEKQPATLTIALDICANSSNQNFFLKKFGKQLTPEDVFYEYQAPGKFCAVERGGVTVEWLIQKFKGIAQDLIIAHPFVSVSVVALPLNESEIKNLLKMGLTGIEVYHNRTTDEQINLLKKMVKEKSLHYTGGSDSHGKENDTQIGQYGDSRDIPDFFLTNHKSNLINN
ncbi:MAG TPA: PHP domain-containing protein [Candidatus Bipolaricaulota bacterium]|nr:PHP domain-containing protein [Candidatus Bipolaricaulota bacterium]